MTQPDLLARAQAHLAAGRLAEAEAAFRQSLDVTPESGPLRGQALWGLGLVAARAGRPDLASGLLEDAARILPGEAEIHLHLGQARLEASASDPAHADLARLALARLDLARALALVPGEPAILEALGRATAARTAIARLWQRRALALAPDFLAARLNLAVLLAGDGAPDRARREIACALTLAPEAASAWFNLGVVRGRSEAACTAFERTLALDPGALDAAVNRSRLLLPTRPSRAEPALRRVAALFPSTPMALTQLAHLARVSALGQDAARLFARAHAADAANPALHSNWLQQLAYDPDLAPEISLARHRDWARRHAGKSRLAVSVDPVDLDPVDLDPGRRLRIGYVSADLARHPVGIFLLPALRHRDPRSQEIVCYSGTRANDAWTDRIRASADRWVEAADLDDDALEERIRTDRIDILVDLSGHTAGNRLPVFARRPAPLQAAWIGYPGSTGLTEIDVVIADSAQVPVGHERWFVERIERLDPGYLAYEPPEDAPDVSSLPALARGHVTFGSLNNPAKLNPRILRLWADVLAAVPGSRLLLAWPSFADPKLEERLRALALASGIAPDRLVLRPGGTPAQFLSRYGEIDIALDPRPYSGGLTTLEALWMGVPVVTCPDERFAGRHAASHLTQAGLADWIVPDERAYVARAAAAAADLDRLNRLRQDLRAQLAASPLLDGAGFAHRLDALWRRIWRRRRAGL